MITDVSRIVLSSRAYCITNREEVWLTKRNVEMLHALALRNLTASTAAHHAKAPAKRSSLIATAVTTSVREISDTGRKKVHKKAQKTQREILPPAKFLRLLCLFVGLDSSYR